MVRVELCSGEIVPFYLITYFTLERLQFSTQFGMGDVNEFTIDFFLLLFSTNFDN